MKLVRRFTPIEQFFHLLLMLGFLIQAATGVARMYVETQWGKSLAGVFGGYAGCLAIHKYVGLVMIALFLLHVLAMLAKLSRTKPRGPDSMLPRASDLGQFLQHLGWMLGLAKHPRFDRWTYWEKFDYWAVFWGMTIIGSTGLLLYNPILTSRYIPGWTLNVALWIHRIEAVLAVGHIVLIHFVTAHLRRPHFPMDKAMFEGTIPHTRVLQERPAWAERLGKQPGLILEAPQPTILRRSICFVLGMAIAVGLAAVFFFALANLQRVTW